MKPNTPNSSPTCLSPPPSSPSPLSLLLISFPPPLPYFPSLSLSLSPSTTNMADPTTTRPPRPTTTTSTGPAQFLHRLHDRSPTSTHLLGILTLAITGGVLLLFTGITITAFVLGLIFLSPLVLLTAPLWVPIAVVVFVFLSFCGFGAAALAAASWTYRYFRGMHPPGSDGFEYARSRIADTAREVKDYAREYGGYLHSKVKDAAPGA